MKETKILNVEGMTCSHCEKAVKSSVGGLEGVDSVAVDLKGKTVTVVYDAGKLEVSSIKDAIEDQGYIVK